MRSFALGVAGLMGSGKSTASSFLVEKLNALYLNGDFLAKELMESSLEVQEQLQESFGVVSEGVIDYAKLAGQVFSDSGAMKKLNSIVHPPLIESLNSTIERSEKLVVLDAALIPLWMDRLHLSASLWVDAAKDIRCERVMARNGFSTDEANSRIEGQELTLQAPLIDEEKWFQIDNSGALDELHKALDSFVATVVGV